MPKKLSVSQQIKKYKSQPPENSDDEVEADDVVIIETKKSNTARKENTDNEKAKRKAEKAAKLEAIESNINELRETVNKISVAEFIKQAKEEKLLKTEVVAQPREKSIYELTLETLAKNSIKY